MYIVVFVLTYLLGSISPSHTLANKFFQRDLHSMGSGNLGAMNTYRNFGIKAGILVFLSDVAKGALAVYLAYTLNVNPLWAMVGVVGGHNFSIFLKLNGGKGLASALGALLMIDFRYAIILTSTGLILLLITKNKYFASIVIAGILPLVVLYYDPSPLSVIAGLFVSFLIIIKHTRYFVSKTK